MKMIVFVFCVLSLWRIGVSGFFVQPEVPQFSTHPRSQLALINTSITLSCSLPLQNASTNLPHPQIHWLINGINVSEVLDGGWTAVTTNGSSYLTSELNISSLSFQHGGYYQCLARDGVTNGRLCSSRIPVPCVIYDVLSSHAWIQPISLEDPEPEERKIQVPGSIHLECGSEVEQTLRKGVSVEWRSMDGSGIVSNTTNTFPLDNGDLMLYVSEGGQSSFGCFITSSSSGPLQYRSYRIVAVDRQDASQMLTNVSIFSTLSLASIGDSIQLTCSVVHGNSSSFLHGIAWTRRAHLSDERISVPGKLQFHDTVLTVNNITMESSGRYCCEVGGVQSCTGINITAKVRKSDPLQLFIDFRENVTHCVNITCSLPQNIIPIHWFWNGITIANNTGHRLVHCSSDPYQLYGIYQCTARDYGQHLGDMGIISRVLPYGITNPVRMLNIMEIPQPSSRGDTYFPVLVSWLPPSYLGNLSTITYKIVSLTEQNTVWRSSDEEVVVDLLKYSFISLEVFVQNEELETISSKTLIGEFLQSSCNGYVFYSPVIRNMSCSTGSVSVDYAANSTLPLLTLHDPREFYFKGNCSNSEMKYKIQYERDSSSPFFAGGGMTFQAGTVCTLAAANTFSRDLLEINPEIQQCHDMVYLAYSNFHSCVVQASVGFLQAQQVVQVSSLQFEVCVQSIGYGFTVDLSANSSAYTNFEGTVLAFTHPSNLSTQCINISINSNSITDESRVMVLSINTENSFVTLESSVSVITIENDAVSIKFKNESITVKKPVSTVDVCILLEGQLQRRSVSVQILMLRNGSKDGLISVGNVTFSPDSQSSQNLSVNIADHDIGNSKDVILSMSSSDPAVKLGRNMVIQLQNKNDVLLMEVSMSISTGLFVGITLLLTGVFALAITGGCIAILKIHQKRTRKSYENFRKELVHSFDHSDEKDDDVFNYLDRHKFIKLHSSEVDNDDNISQIESLEPMLKRTSGTTSPVMSVMWVSVDEPENLKDSSRFTDNSGGYINHVDKDDDKTTFPTQSEHASHGLSDQHLRLQMEPLAVSTTNSVVPTTDVLLVTDHGPIQGEAPNNLFFKIFKGGGSSTNSHHTGGDLTVQLGGEMESYSCGLSREETVHHRADAGNEDSGYPHSSQDTD